MQCSTYRHVRRESGSTVSFVLRALQLAFSAMAMVLFAGSFKSENVTIRAADGKSVSVTTYLGGPYANFALLVSFSASLYALLWIVFVHLRRDVALPVDVAIVIDALFVVLTVSGGSAFLASDYIQHCDVLSKSIRCGLLTTATAFILVSFLVFLCSVAWGAYTRLEEKKNLDKKTRFRPSGTSAINVPPSDGLDLEEAPEVSDYVATDSHGRGMR